MNKRSRKGFTLAELLVVVAIIAVLVAVAIPVFSSQLNEARVQTDHANIRAAYAMMRTAELAGKYTNTAGEDATVVAGKLYFTKTGGLGDAGDGYVLQGNEETCSLGVVSGLNHAKGNKITVTFAVDSDTGAITGTLALGTT